MYLYDSYSLENYHLTVSCSIPYVVYLHFVLGGEGHTPVIFSINADVINELIQESYPKAIAENNIKPACSPQVSIDSEDPKKPIIYSAIIEVFPEIKPKFSRWTNYEKFDIF